MAKHEVRDTAFYEKLANIYRDAVKANQPPTRTVSEKMKLPYTTATSAVQRAKWYGYLEDIPRREWATSRKAEAVAKELNLKPERLVKALRNHGGVLDVRERSNHVAAAKKTASKKKDATPKKQTAKKQAAKK